MDKTEQVDGIIIARVLQLLACFWVVMTCLFLIRTYSSPSRERVGIAYACSAIGVSASLQVITPHTSDVSSTERAIPSIPWYVLKIIPNYSSTSSILVQWYDLMLIPSAPSIPWHCPDAHTYRAEHTLVLSDDHTELYQRITVPHEALARYRVPGNNTTTGIYPSIPYHTTSYTVPHHTIPHPHPTNDSCKILGKNMHRRAAEGHAQRGIAPDTRCALRA